MEQLSFEFAEDTSIRLNSERFSYVNHPPTIQLKYYFGDSSESQPTQFQNGMFVSVEKLDSGYAITYNFEPDPIQLLIEWIIASDGDWIDEQITLTNNSDSELHITEMNIGLIVSINEKLKWNLIAVPFRVQPNGREYYFTIDELKNGRIQNPTYSTDCKFWPPICDSDRVRSEAWFMGTDQEGLMIIKHNPHAIEYSLIKMTDDGLRIGGIDFALYSEPQRATSIDAHSTYQFGITRYLLVLPDELYSVEQKICLIYTDFLVAQGHGYPESYNPPVHWNELYDVGWYHSDHPKLEQFYTRDALLQEAENAKNCHAESLYLDPGWEVAEGSTLFDEDRLGTAKSLVDALCEKGLYLAFRTILRDYKGWIPEEWQVDHKTDEEIPFSWEQLIRHFQEPCVINPEYFQEKLNRITAIASAGVSFIMCDEMDWRGPCFNEKHHHKIPSSAADHADAVYNLCHEIRKTIQERLGYDILLEVHDPIWPWANRYCPSYYRQGFSLDKAYQENWGFEFMWNCIQDLRAGKALMLYYYAFACPIPLYLHITMSHDNEKCLFFWWAASTVRHLGIGGRTCNPTICQTKMVHDFDLESQYERYQTAMDEYQQNKAWFVRGRFIGINEECHLHVFPEKKGGVIQLFNLDLHQQTKTETIPWKLLNIDYTPEAEVEVRGTTEYQIKSDETNFIVEFKIEAESCVRLYLGDAVFQN